LTQQSSLAVKGSFVLPNFRQGYKADQAGTPVEGVPDFIPPLESPLDRASGQTSYQLSLITPKSHAFLSSGYANMRVQRHAMQQAINARCFIRTTLWREESWMARSLRYSTIVGA